MARSPAPVVTRRRLDPADRRAQIIDAAAGAFVARGFVATPIADVADRAGVTVRIVYRHFRSKDALYRAVLERTVARLGPVCEHPADVLDWSAAAVVGYQLEAVLTWLDHGRADQDERLVRATRAALRAGVRAWAAG